MLDLDVIMRPCPKGGDMWRPQAIARGGKTQFPFLVDPNTGVRGEVWGGMRDWLPRMCCTDCMRRSHAVLIRLETGSASEHIAGTQLVGSCSLGSPYSLRTVRVQLEGGCRHAAITACAYEH